MLSKSRRLSSQEVKGVFLGGRKTSGGGVTLIYKRKDRGHTKLSVVVSSKTIRTATERNRLRRIYYSTIGSLLKNIKGSFLGVLIVKRDVDKKNTKALRGNLERLMKKVGMIA